MVSLKFVLNSSHSKQLASSYCRVTYIGYILFENKKYLKDFAEVYRTSKILILKIVRLTTTLYNNLQ